MERDLQYYLKNGYPPEVAEYFTVGGKEVIGVVANSDYTITISYDNGVKKMYDIKPFIKSNKFFNHLEKIEEFKKVKYSKGRIFWDDMTDLCGDSCYIYGLTLRNDDLYKEPPEVTEYFETNSKDVINVVANNDYTLTILYSNGVKKLYDVKPFMKIKCFKRLENIDEFKKVKHSKGRIFWDDMTDLCGDSCYIYGLTLRNT